MHKSKPAHILVIRLSAMGDVAMTVPVLLALSKTYPDLKITVLTKSFLKPLFSQISNVTVHSADVKGKHKGFLGLYRLYKELRVLNIDAVADLHNVLRSNILKQFFWLSGIKTIQIDKGRAKKKRLTAGKNKVFKQLKTSHQRYAKVFEKLGFSIDLNHNYILPKQELNLRLQDLSCPKSHKWIGIAPFAAFEGKTYPLHLMESVLKTLNESTNKYQIILFGGMEEKLQLEKWETHFTNCISLVGKATFAQELTMLSNLDLMLAMDSGNAHLAAMYGVPTVTLWGVTHPYAGFYPFGQDKGNALLSDREKYPLIPTSIYGNKVPEGYENVMETIAPEQIAKKIAQVLDKA